MRAGKLAIIPIAAAVLTLSSCGGSGEPNYDVSGRVTDKQTGQDCDQAAGQEVIEPISYEGRTSGGSSGGGRGGSRNGSSGGSGSSGGTSSLDCETEYEIFLDTQEDDVDVTHTHYDRCEVGERFPSCTGNGQ
jgi:hypothetical protein